MESGNVSAAAGALAVALHKSMSEKAGMDFVLDIPLVEWEYVLNIALCCAAFANTKFFRRKKQEAARWAIVRGAEHIFPNRPVLGDFAEALDALDISKRVFHIGHHEVGQQVRPWVWWACDRLAGHVSDDRHLAQLIGVLNVAVVTQGAELGKMVRA